MSVPFPTRPEHHTTRPQLGTPQQARTCRCENAWLNGDECVKCGYYVERIVRQTFHDQARRTSDRKPSPVRVDGPQETYKRSQRKRRRLEIAA